MTAAISEVQRIIDINIELEIIPIPRFNPDIVIICLIICEGLYLLRVPKVIFRKPIRVTKKRVPIIRFI